MSAKRKNREWYVNLMFNEAVGTGKDKKLKTSQSKSITEVNIYGYAYDRIKNLSEKDGNWMTVQMVGPFANKAEAEEYNRWWVKKVRSKSSKILRGLDLLETYYEAYNLTMWAPSKVKSQLVEERRARTAQLLVSYDGQDIDTIRKMQKRRETKKQKIAK